MEIPLTEVSNSIEKRRVKLCVWCNVFFSVPGRPSNITYKIVNCNELTEYCHLNVSWMHPYNQNGTINVFILELNETSVQNKIKVVSYIVEVFKLTKKQYAPIYNYQVISKEKL